MSRTRKGDHGQERLLEIIRDVAAGNYSDDIMELTGPGYSPEIQELAEAVGMMMVKIEAREFHLEQLYQRIKNNSLKTVTSIASALGARDKYTEGHGERVGNYAARIARRLDLDESAVDRIRLAGVLHDIGKIGFSDALFANEDTRPTPEMMEEIRSHPDWGFEILKDLDFLGPIPEWVHSHHEKIDGTGYPRGIDGKDIPLESRILAVADTFDAITTNRPYQQGRTPDEAFAILRKISDTVLDAELVELFAEEFAANGSEG